MKHDSLYIIMPAYNEEKNIGTVIEQWYPVVERIGGDITGGTLSKYVAISRIAECT